MPHLLDRELSPASPPSISLQSSLPTLTLSHDAANATEETDANQKGTLVLTSSQEHQALPENPASAWLWLLPLCLWLPPSPGLVPSACRMSRFLPLLNSGPSPLFGLQWFPVRSLPLFPSRSTVSSSCTPILCESHPFIIFSPPRTPLVIYRYTLTRSSSESVLTPSGC